MGLKFGQCGGDAGGVGAVVDGFAVAAGGEQAALAEQGQLLGGGGVGDARLFGDVAHGELDVAGELQHELLPGFAGQGFEEASRGLAEVGHVVRVADVSSFREFPILSRNVDV